MTLPPLATDCHVHVFDPARFPYALDRRYTPPPAGIEALRQMHAGLGIERVVLVQPSVYGADNRCLLDALRRLGATARGIAVIDAGADRQQLQELVDAGVRGVRINLGVNRASDPRAALKAIRETANTLDDMPMLIQLHASLPVLLACAPLLRVLRQEVLIDHFGLAMAAAGPAQAGFAELLDLMACKNMWIKLSGPYQISVRAPGYADVAPIAKAFLQAQPDRVLWGSDWPHTGGSQRAVDHHASEVEPFRNEDERSNLYAVAGRSDPEVLHRLLVSNPARLFGF